jgi:hypothetical protein
MRRNVFSLAIAASLTLGFPATAAPEQASFRLFGVVHTICRVNFAGEGQVTANRIDFGSVEQQCNSRTGFRVTMVHPANLQGATFVIGDRRVPLSPGNETVIIDENHPIFTAQAAELDLGAANSAPPVLSFRVEAKGVVY